MGSSPPVKFPRPKRKKAEEKIKYKRGELAGGGVSSRNYIVGLVRYALYG